MSQESHGMLHTLLQTQYKVRQRLGGAGATVEVPFEAARAKWGAMMASIDDLASAFKSSSSAVAGMNCA